MNEQGAKAGGKLHHVGSEVVHSRWKADIDPVLTTQPGDRVMIECRDGFDGQANPPVTGHDLDTTLYSTIDFRRVAPLTGPIAMQGAQPGDTLEVRVLDIIPFGTGTIVIFPSWVDNDFLLNEQRLDFPDAWVRSFDMNAAWKDGFIELTPRTRIPLSPMMGMLGTAPAKGEFITTPPRDFGGNMDVKDVAKGNTVYLPVFQPGALLSPGDGHGMQGDGEMCTTGLETPVRVTVELHLHGGRSIPGPQIESPDEFMTVSYGRTLDQAARRAMRYMIDYLVERQGLDSHEAYAFLSLAGDLRINQVVDFPHVGVRVAIPKSCLDPWEW
jgi:acetamidase/formamidase